MNIHLFFVRKRINYVSNDLNKHLKNDFIKSSKFVVEIFILFVEKDDNFRLHVNHKKLNKIMIKSKYSLFFIDENLNRLNKIKMFIQLNLIATYYKMRIKQENE